MTKIKITTLTDKISDDEILSKLKGIGVKIKDKAKDETPHEEAKEKSAPTGETLVEKRVASTIIRRRVQAPPPPPPVEEKPEPVEEKADIKETLRATEKEKAAAKPKERTREITRTPVAGASEIEAPPPEEGAPVAAIEPDRAPEQEAVAEEPSKGEIERMGQDKEKEITKVLEEAYKQDLEKEVPLTDETEEERQKKKTEKLLKKIEDAEFAETKGVKKKGLLKRKVVIKEEDLYTFRRGKGKPMPGRKSRDRLDDRHDDDRKAEGRQARKIIKVGDAIQVSEFAKKLGVKAQDIVTRLLPLGIIVPINQNIDFDTASFIGNELGYDIEKIVSIEDEFLALEEEQKESSSRNLRPRSPVVTIMGHVDHGKTLLLDTIRHTNVAEKEAGGITQHIGAYVVNIEGKEIVFVDTPGHEAFTSMRARGARVTDIVVLVVAADDGVMPQTIEAINHAKAANVPIIVAINKIDKQNANVDRVLKELTEYGLVPEDWGGTTLFAKISAKQKVGIKELLELIALQAEMLELTADPDQLAKGIIIESELDKGQGPIGTVIIQEGTLKIGDPFIAGSMFGRVRAMLDDKGKRIQKAPPSRPVLVVGFQDVPHGGDRFIVTTEERYARELSKFRQERLKEKEITKSSRTTLEELYSKMHETGRVTLNVIVKGDVRGTIDAIVEALRKLSNDQVEIQIIHSGVGAITETDVNLAMASGAIIIGFNTRPVAKAQALAEHEKIDIRTYSIIYELIDEIRKAMEGMLAPKIVETEIGKAEVRKVFSVSRIGTIAGCYMTEGKATRNSIVKVSRAGNILFTGKLASLKRFKDDVKEVLAGYECGISVEGFNDIKEGDVLLFSIQEKEKQTLDG
ncbi:MAG TPA: translation initiation factor IF-2 [Syntrophorhabdaceae bacterium]|jgi:translation initiation factor IF-2